MPFYDFLEDESLICGAFCKSFGIMPADFYKLTYAEYCVLFPSIDGECTFANVVRNRMETDQKKIKAFSSVQKEDWNKWHKRSLEWQEKEAKRINLVKKRQDYEEGRKEARKKLEALLGTKINYKEG